MAATLLLQRRQLLLVGILLPNNKRNVDTKTLGDRQHRMCTTPRDEDYPACIRTVRAEPLRSLQVLGCVNVQLLVEVAQVACITIRMVEPTRCVGTSLEGCLGNHEGVDLGPTSLGPSTILFKCNFSVHRAQEFLFEWLPVQDGVVIHVLFEISAAKRLETGCHAMLVCDFQAEA